MPSTTLPSDEAAIANRHFQRTERFERQTIAPMPRVAMPTIFSYPGPLTVNIESPPWYPSSPGYVLMVRVSLLAAATTDHTIEVRVDGTPIVQYTLPTGQNTVAFGAHIQVEPQSYVTVKTIAVTDSDMTVTMEVG